MCYSDIAQFNMSTPSSTTTSAIDDAVLLPVDWDSIDAVGRALEHLKPGHPSSSDAEQLLHRKRKGADVIQHRAFADADGIVRTEKHLVAIDNDGNERPETCIVTIDSDDDDSVARPQKRSRHAPPKRTTWSAPDESSSESSGSSDPDYDEDDESSDVEDEGSSDEDDDEEEDEDEDDELSEEDYDDDDEDAPLNSDEEDEDDSDEESGEDEDSSEEGDTEAQVKFPVAARLVKPIPLAVTFVNELREKLTTEFPANGVLVVIAPKNCHVVHLATPDEKE